eukprot:scaffold501_cov195-Alexandrium_tamarense.AAC.15
MTPTVPLPTSNEPATKKQKTNQRQYGLPTASINNNDDDTTTHISFGYSVDTLRTTYFQPSRKWSGGVFRVSPAALSAVLSVAESE